MRQADHPEEELKAITDRIMRRVLKRPEALHSANALQEVVSEFLPVPLA